MIPFKPIESLFSIGFFNIKAWGLMVALGFLLGLFIAVKEAKRKNLDTNKLYSLALYSLIFGIIGGRLGYILTVEQLPFIDFFNILQGGLIWHGAFLGGLAGAYIAIAKDELRLKYLDVFGIALPLGHAIGRIGCFLTGLHPGKIADLPWSVFLEGQLRHPVTGYELIAELTLFAIIFRIRKKKFFDGAIFSFYTIGYSLLRFALDFFRTDPTYAGLTIAQWASVALFFIFAWIIVKNRRDLI